MPRLTFPISPDGLNVAALVGLRGAATATLHAAGQPIPAPIRGRGLIDTGCNTTAVNRSILQRLGLSPHYHTSTQTVAGAQPATVYKVSLSITALSTAGAPLWTHPDLLVMELATALPAVDVLIGMDILLGCRMLVDGPARRFTLDF